MKIPNWRILVYVVVFLWVSVIGRDALSGKIPAEDYVVKFDYKKGSGRHIDKDVAAIDGRLYTWKVTNYPRGSTFKWMDRKVTGGKWIGGDGDSITLHPYASAGSYSIRVEVYPPGEGVGPVWYATGKGGITAPTVEFNAPQEDVHICAPEKGEKIKAINVYVTVTHLTKETDGPFMVILKDVRVEFSEKDEPRKGSFDPEYIDTGSSGIATTKYTPFAEAGYQNVLQAKCGITTQTDHKVTIIKVEITGVDKEVVCINGTAQFTAEILPTGRTIVWSIEHLTCGTAGIDLSGKLWACPRPGSITVKAADSEASNCFDTATIEVWKVVGTCSALYTDPSEGAYVPTGQNIMHAGDYTVTVTICEGASPTTFKRTLKIKSNGKTLCKRIDWFDLPPSRNQSGKLFIAKWYKENEAGSKTGTLEVNWSAGKYKGSDEDSNDFTVYVP